MESAELRRLVVRQRHVAPMLSALLAGTDAAVVITDLEGAVILERGSPGADAAGSASGANERHAILVERQTVGWVSGPRPAAAVAAVLSYACAREADKRSLAREALDRYRELNLIYDLADTIGADLDVDAVARVAAAEASGLPTGGTGFMLLRSADDSSRLVAVPGDGAGPIATASATHGILGAILAGEAEIVNDVSGDARATDEERIVASLVAAPLRVRGERIGVVGAASADAVVFTASDLKLLAAIAAIAAPTIDQAAAHEAAIQRSDGADGPG
jgi:putative methionine-R-sulfoxide reductase with GAF domain